MTHFRSVTAACLVSVLAVAVGSAVWAADGPEDAAQSAAVAGLRLVDGGDYAASWAQAGRALKGAVKQAEWSETAEKARAPLCALASRKLKSREYTEKATTMRVIGGRVYGWGDGRYVVIQDDSAFASRASAVETVIAAADPDRAWRVAGYSIR